RRANLSRRVTRRGKMITSNASHSIMVTIRKPRIAIMYLNPSITLLVPAQFGLPRGYGFADSSHKLNLTRRGTHNLPASCKNFDNLRFVQNQLEKLAVRKGACPRF